MDLLKSATLSYRYCLLAGNGVANYLKTKGEWGHGAPCVWPRDCWQSTRRVPMVVSKMAANYLTNLGVC